MTDDAKRTSAASGAVPAHAEDTDALSVPADPDVGSTRLRVPRNPFPDETSAFHPLRTLAPSARA
jgi:hypothetical protein